MTIVIQSTSIPAYYMPGTALGLYRCSSVLVETQWSWHYYPSFTDKNIGMLKMPNATTHL